MSLSSTPVWFEEFLEPRETKSSVFHVDYDPLVMAAAAHRYFSRNKKYPDSVAALDFVMADYELADQIRNYYSAKLVELSLNGQPLSPFRAKLAGLVNGRTVLEASEVGLLYRLADFYFEDIATDWVFNNTKPVLELARSLRLPQTDTEFDLVPLRRVVRKRHSNGAVVRYWFSNQDDNPCCITSVANNIMLPLMDDLFSRARVRMVSSFNCSELPGGVRSRNSRYYWNLFNFRLTSQ